MARKRARRPRANAAALSAAQRRGASLDGHGFIVPEARSEAAVRDSVDKRPMKGQSDQHCDVKNFVWLDHAGKQRWPAELLHNGADRVGDAAPKDGGDKGEPESPP